MELYEESPELRGPPEATLVRRAKSYSDFYQVATSYLHKEFNAEKSEAAFDNLERNCAPKSTKTHYEDLENDLLDYSHEEFESVHTLNLSDAY